MMDIHQQYHQVEDIGIMISHWKNDDNILHCQNQSCNIQFGLTKRKYHCRRCGNVYCCKCTLFRRRLSVLAQLDPVLGKFYKVCECCFAEGISSVEDGQRKDLTFYFGRLRDAHKRNKFKEVYGLENINFEAEVLFLVTEFEKKDQKSNALTRMVSTDFQRQISSSTDKGSCTLCHNSFNLLMLRRHCNICCLLCCGDCCSDDLLLYRESSVSQLIYRWSIINVVGCPEKEPAVCCYVRVCHACKYQLTNIQQTNVFIEDNDSVVVGDMSETLNSLQPLRNKIEQHIMNYEDMADSFDISRPAEGSASSRTSSSGTIQPLDTPRQKGTRSIKQLAKIQCDLTDLLCDVALITQKITLKLRNKELTPFENIILTNMKRAWCSFYVQNMDTFRQLRNKFEEIVPQTILTAVQREVDRQAITTAYLYIHQLGLEVLLLTDRHEINGEFSVHLAGLDSAMKQELDSFISSSNEENPKCYDEDLQNFVKHRIKEGKNLIKLSSTLKQKYGSKYVESFAAERCSVSLEKIHLQFNDKCLDTNFKNTKMFIKNTTDYFNSIVNK